MFLFIIKRFGVLKHIPGLARLFDYYMLLWQLITRPAIIHCISDIEDTISAWNDISILTHKYGGLQFNYRKKELGHIHSNGLTDILLTLKLKNELLDEGKIQHHHSFKNSGWISFYIKSRADKDYVLKLFKLAYQNKKKHLF